MNNNIHLSAYARGGCQYVARRTNRNVSSIKIMNESGIAIYQ